MKNKLPGSAATSLYPGTYRPAMPDQPTSTSHTSSRFAFKTPRFTVHDLQNCYVIEIEMAGFLNSNILINTHNHELLVSAIKSTIGNPAETGTSRSNEILSFEIALPPDLNTDFSSARYTQDRLQLFFQKSSGVADDQNHQIYVY